MARKRLESQTSPICHYQKVLSELNNGMARIKQANALSASKVLGNFELPRLVFSCSPLDLKRHPIGKRTGHVGTMLQDVTNLINRFDVHHSCSHQAIDKSTNHSDYPFRFGKTGGGPLFCKPHHF